MHLNRDLFTYYNGPCLLLLLVKSTPLGGVMQRELFPSSRGQPAHRGNVGCLLGGRMPWAWR